MGLFSISTEPSFRCRRCSKDVFDLSLMTSKTEIISFSSDGRLRPRRFSITASVCPTLSWNRPRPELEGPSLKVRVQKPEFKGPSSKAGALRPELKGRVRRPEFDGPSLNARVQRSTLKLKARSN